MQFKWRFAGGSLMGLFLVLVESSVSPQNKTEKKQKKNVGPLLTISLIRACFQMHLYWRFKG